MVIFGEFYLKKRICDKIFCKIGENSPKTKHWAKGMACRRLSFFEWYLHPCLFLIKSLLLDFVCNLIDIFHYARLIFTPCLFWVGFVFNFVCNLIHIYSLDMVWVVLNFLDYSLLLMATLCHLKKLSMENLVFLFAILWCRWWSSTRKFIQILL